MLQKSHSGHKTPLSRIVAELKVRGDIHRDSDIARDLGYDKSVISAYKSGKTKISSQFIEKLEKFYNIKYEHAENGSTGAETGQNSTQPGYSDKVIALLERENERLRIDLETMKEAVLLSLKGLSQSERLIRAMLKASLQLDVERDAKGNQKKLEALRRKVSSMINTNYKGRQPTDKTKDGSKQMVNELP